MSAAVCRPDCRHCTQMAWAWANVVEREGMGNVEPPDCADCAYCTGGAT